MYLGRDGIHFLVTITQLRWFLWLSCIVHLATGFTLNESLPVYSQKAYSIYSPLETYDYYSKFPFCQPNKTSRRKISLLDNIKGNVYSLSPYTMHYLQPVNDANICNVTLIPSDIQQLKYEIDEGFIYELVIDHITFRLPFGYHQNEAYYVPTKIHFRMVFNNETILSKSFVQIEDSLVLPDSKKQNVTLSLSYGVSWINEFNYIEKPLIDGDAPVKRLSQNNIRRLGVTNSFLLASLFSSIVIILIFFLMRSDLRNYIKCPDEERGIAEEIHGWKVLYGDIVRPPRHRNFFCACVAAGIQIFLMVLALMRLVLVPNFRNEKEKVTFLGAMFILASVLAAYIASFLYRRVSGIQWKNNILLSIFVFMGPCWVVCLGTNFIAHNYQSSRYLPNFILLKIFYLWLLILFPVLVVSCIVGRYHAAEMMNKSKKHSQKTTQLAREIPRCSWKQSPWCHICIAGLISFLAVGIDFHVILSTLWGSAQDINLPAWFSTLFVNLITTGSLSLLINYYHLNKEDYRWHWRSFFSGGFLAVYQVVYTILFALNSSDDSSFLQLALFLSYSFLFAWAVFLVFGCVTFFLNYLFVLYIYSTTRFD